VNNSLTILEDVLEALKYHYESIFFMQTKEKDVERNCLDNFFFTYKGKDLECKN